MIDIIFIVICASLCGADTWDDIKGFGKAKKSWFQSVKPQQNQEVRYYISSLNISAREMGEIVRSHWGEENSLHWVLGVGYWVLDMAFQEEECPKRKESSV